MLQLLVDSHADVNTVARRELGQPWATLAGTSGHPDSGLTRSGQKRAVRS